MLLAKPAVPQIPNSIKERTDCTSSLATHAVPEDLLLPSRPVSLLKSESVADNKVKRINWVGSQIWGYWEVVTNIASQCNSSIAFGNWFRILRHIDGFLLLWKRTQQST